MKIARYHLPGIFEFLELYKVFLPLFRNHREYFYDWCEIDSVYGAPSDCLWGGGRTGFGENGIEKDVLALVRDWDVSVRLTFSNSLLEKQHLNDRLCNRLLSTFHDSKNGIITASPVLEDYIKDRYPEYYLVSSTTKVLDDFEDFKKELENQTYSFVVPDFTLNVELVKLARLDDKDKEKTEFLCNECCVFGCKSRKRCYESVSRKSLGVSDGFVCPNAGDNEGYLFSKAMENKGFIGIREIKDVYMPMGFSNFKIEGRSLGSALVFEMLLYYMVKPEYQLKVRELVYLDNTLDLF